MLASMALADPVLALPVEIERYTLERRELAVSSQFTRVSTTVVAEGRGERGFGEDVTYTPEDHNGFPDALPLAGSWTVGDLSRQLDGHDLFAAPPAMHASLDYRRWAFESAALDLALRQAGRSLGDLVGREYRPVRFVVSSRGDILAWLAAIPGLEFKVDAAADWTRERMSDLAGTGRIRVVDLKAFYRGTSVDLPPDPDLYRGVAEIFADAVIEDPWLEDGCREALAGAEDRLSFDAPIHSLADVDTLPLAPRWLNVKPSRFGTVARLLECIEACEARGISMYGGGQFELGPGRPQIQRLASLFYADGPNDVAPGEYNDGDPRPGLPTSPLPAFAGVGL
jgi:L-alanine-DL-glutamate epimerase-like enolase superfamily enzyme